MRGGFLLHALLKQLRRNAQTRPVRWATGIWLVSMAAALIWSARRGDVLQPLQLEFLVYLALLPAIAMLPVVRRFVSRLPRPHRWALAVLLTTLLTGQMTGDDRGIFPVVRWHMYSKPIAPDNASVLHYFGVSASGERIRLNPSTLFPSLGGGTLRLHNRMEQLTKAAQIEHEPGLQQRIEQRLNNMLRALATRHNQTAAPHRRVTQVQIWRGDNVVRYVKVTGQPSWKSIYRVEVSGNENFALQRTTRRP